MELLCETRWCWYSAVYQRLLDNLVYVKIIAVYLTYKTINPNITGLYYSIIILLKKSNKQSKFINQFASVLIFG